MRRRQVGEQRIELGLGAGCLSRGVPVGVLVGVEPSGGQMLVEGLLSGRALCIADADLRMWRGHPPSVRTAWAWRIVRIVNRYEAWLSVVHI